MTDINHLLWEIQGRLTAIEHKLDAAEKEVRANTESLAKLRLLPRFHLKAWVDTLLGKALLCSVLTASGVKMADAILMVFK